MNNYYIIGTVMIIGAVIYYAWKTNLLKKVEEKANDINVNETSFPQFVFLVLPVFYPALKNYAKLMFNYIFNLALYSTIFYGSYQIIGSFENTIIFALAVIVTKINVKKTYI